MIQIIRCIITTVGIALFLLFLIPFLLYIPAVQNKAREIVTEIASKQLNMDVSLESVRLRFPLDLELRKALVITAEKDTMVECDALVLNIGLRKIFRKEIEIKELGFEKTKVHFTSKTGTLDIKINVEELRLQARPVNLGSETVDLPDIMLKGGDVSLKLVSSPPDTTASSPFKWAFRVNDLILDNIAFKMEMSPNARYLKSGIGYARLKDGFVDVGECEVKLSYAGINDARCVYLYTPSAEPDTLAAADQKPSKPWTIRVDSVSLQNANATYGKLGHIPKMQFDPDYISVSGLNITASDVYNCAAAVKVNLDNLSFVERSGFRITHTEGDFVMDSTRIALQNFSLNTYYSQITGSVDAAASALRQAPDASVFANIKAGISLLDLMYFEPSFRSTLKILPVNRIEAAADVRGTLSDISLRSVSATIPGYAGVSLNGSLYGLVSKRGLSGRVNIKGDVRDGSFIVPLISSASDTTIAIPKNIKFGGVVSMRGDSITPIINLSIGKGKMNLAGGVNYKRERYTVSLGITDFPLGDFLPHKGLGLLSASLDASGRKFNPLHKNAVADIALAVDTLDYNNYRYKDIDIALNESGGRYSGSLKSRAEAAPADITFSGLLTDAMQSADIKGAIGTVDLQKLNFTQEQITVNTTIDIAASAKGAGIYSVKGGLGNTAFFMYGVKRTLPGLDIDFVSDSTSVNAAVSAEQVAVNFVSPVSLNALISGIDSTISMAKAQVDSLDIDALKLHNALPPLRFSVKVGNNPVLNTVLKRNNMGVKGAELSFVSSASDPLEFYTGVYGFTSGGIEIDTVNFTLKQDTSQFTYKLYVNDNQQLYDGQSRMISLYGHLFKNVLNLNYKQQLSTGEASFMLGSEIELYKNRVHFAITPLDPIIGGERCSVNQGNYVNYYFDRHIEADLDITSGNRYLGLYSPEGSEGKELGVKISDIDISSLLSLWPLAPPIGGILSSDLILALSEKHISAAGNLGIDGFTYDKQTVGDIALKMDYSVLENELEQVNVSLFVNKNEAVALTGLYDPSGKEPIALKMLIKSLPLMSVNPFLPDDYSELTGVLNGDLSVGGKLEDVKLNGYLQFADATLTVPMIGTTFNLSKERISVDDNVITMKNFGLSGPNNNPLNINGTVSLGNIQEMISDVYRIKTDINISAKNFQLVNVKKNRQTQVYGKAFADIGVSVKGALNSLKVSGNAALLNGTEVTYTLPESTIGEQEDVSGLVTFVSFNDTTDQEQIIPIHKAPWGMDMSIDVSIGQAVKMAVNLTPDGETGINIQGGGNLVYTMNMLGDTRFAGRYNITSGTVRYSPPIISSKVFKITQGSYVEWSGDIADPLFNITAEQKIKSTVTESGANKQVNFYVVITVKNTLDNLAIGFDLTAPEDMTISNELAAMTSEQRSEQAISMMVYNTYTGGSNTQSSFDGNTAINAFLQKELNQWARNNLKNVDLTFGVDSYKNASGTSSTDYSYELSKSLFNDRFKVVVGGSYNTEVAPDQVAQNLIGDVTLEYQLDERDNMLIKIFRNTQNDILEGTVIDYGIGFAVRKQVIKLKELFEVTGRKEKVEKRREVKKEEGVK